MRLKESETLELKKSTGELKEAVVSMSAMLNKHGRGEIYFGVEVGNHFIAVFRRRTGTTLPPIVSQNGKKKTVEKTVEKIIALIRRNPTITQEMLQSKSGLTRRGVEWNLKNLKETGLIRRVGPDKGGHWEVLNLRHRLRSS